MFYLRAKQRETIYEKIKAWHNCDRNVTIHDITSGGTDGGVQAAPPDKLNVKTGPPLVDILIFSFL